MKSHLLISLFRFIPLFVVFILGITHATYSLAETKLELAGELIQGALVHGRVSPGVAVEVLGRDVFVNPQGEFVFGLGRDMPAELVVTTINSNGEAEKHTFAVKQREYNIQRIEGVEQKYVEPPEEVLERIKRENASVWRARQTLREEKDFAGGFIWPAKGPVTGVYGSQRVYNGVPKRPHFGLDIAGPIGEKVMAPAPGVVTLVNDDMYYSGGTLLVDHGQGISSTFIHLSKIHVKEGERVERGQLIAEIGASGRVTGPHLDWRVNWFDERLDPALLLPPKAGAH